MNLLNDEKAQGAIETLGLIAAATVVVIIVGFYLKGFVTTEIQGEVNTQLNPWIYDYN